METKTKALTIARIAHDKKAGNIVVLDVRDVCNFTDFFVLASGDTSNHLRAVCDEITETLKDSGVTLYGLDGLNAAHWRVLDYGDVVFHCFTDEIRHRYDIEHLWGDAQSVEWRESS